MGRDAPAPAEHQQDQDGDGAAAARREGKPTMFCSLEDVIETMLKEDIFDEEDLELGRVSKPAVLLRAGSSLSRQGTSLPGLGLRSGSSRRLRFSRSGAWARG